MPTALTLALDEEGHSRIEALWRELDGIGLGDPRRRPGHPPHLTLAVVAEDASDVDLAWPVPPSLRITHLGLFTAPEMVLFLAPLVTPRLLEAQQRAAAALGGFTLLDHWRPGGWVPHVTLAHGVSDAGDLRRLCPIDLPFELGIAAVEMVSFPPARVLARHPIF